MAPNFREDMVRITQHTGKKLENGRQTVRKWLCDGITCVSARRTHALHVKYAGKHGTYMGDMLPPLRR